MTSLREEQAAFDAQLEKLLPEHAGQYAVVKDGVPVKFFATHPEAYEFALDEYGLDAVFLIARVSKDEPEPVSLAWESGVMFG